MLDDGRAIGESGAILCFFGEGTRFVPDDPFERAQVLQWLFFEQYDAEPNLAVPRFWLLYSGRPEAMPDRLEEGDGNGKPALPPMEGPPGGPGGVVGGSRTRPGNPPYGDPPLAGGGGV